MNDHLLPILARVRMSRAAEDGPGLWVPLFLLWPLWWLALGLILLTLLTVTAVTGSRAFAASWGATVALHRMACGLRGVRCDVKDDHMYFSIALL